MRFTPENKSWFTALALIFLAALARLIPHPPNFTPMTAMALLGMAYLKPRWLAFVFPLAALWLSNLVLDNLVYAEYYDHFMWFSNPGVFLSFLLVSMLAFWAFRQMLTAKRIALSALGASLLFWFSTNFFVWLQSGMYPKNAAGLLACYTAALPFLRNALLGDLFFTALLFGLYALLLGKKIPAMKAKA